MPELNLPDLNLPELNLIDAWDRDGNLAASLLLDAAPQAFTTYLLGVNAGIGHFKSKWGAEHFLPYVETHWDVSAPGLFGRLFKMRRG